MAQTQTMRRVAVASSDGDYVDEHYGNALFYQVYDKSGEQDWAFAETRRVSPSCGGSVGCGETAGCGGGEQDCAPAAPSLAERLSDCDAIIVFKIGPAAAAKAIKSGLRVFEAAGPVDDVLDYLVAKGLLKAPEEGGADGTLA